MTYNYKVEYSENGETLIEEIEASNPGTAFAMCLKSHPESTLIRAVVEGKGNGYAYTEHFPPPVQRLPVPRVIHRKKEHMGCEFPFYDEVKRSTPQI